MFLRGAITAAISNITSGRYGAILRRLFLKVAVINIRKVMTVLRKFKVAASYNICLH